jgi:hypothetical protein
MKTHLFFAFLLPATLGAAVAQADDKAACLEAASKGQRFKDNHKLVEAREQLRVCAAAVCPAVVQSDCAGWLAEVDAALPSVVLAAKSAAGADLVEVKVTLDGQPLVSSLDGHAVRMNAGPHAFHFAGADGAVADKQVLVREGERNQSVTAVLGPAPVKPSPARTNPPPPTEANGPGTGPQAQPGTEPAPGGGGGSSMKTIGWVLGAGGVAGLAVGTIFGFIATGDKSAAHCVNNVCDPGTVGGIKSASLVSDVGWIGGALLLAGGASLVLLAPSDSGSTTGVRVVPVVTASGAGLVTEGSF